MSFIRSLCFHSTPSKLKFSLLKEKLFTPCQKKISSQSLLNVNTNVSKDVILFRYNNPRYYKYLTFFGLSQCVFWMYLSHSAYTTLRDTPIKKKDVDLPWWRDTPIKKKDVDLPWWRKINLGEQKFRNGISLCCGVLGYLFLIASFFYTIRSVKYLILRKGGKQLSIVTYGPYGLKDNIMDVPVKCVSASQCRDVARVQLPIKVQGRYLYYMLDMKGEFLNPTLFDATAGLRRKLS